MLDIAIQVIVVPNNIIFSNDVRLGSEYNLVPSKTQNFFQKFWCYRTPITSSYLATVLRTSAQILASLGLQIPAIRYNSNFYF